MILSLPPPYQFPRLLGFFFVSLSLTNVSIQCRVAASNSSQHGARVGDGCHVGYRRSQEGSFQVITSSLSCRNDDGGRNTISCWGDVAAPHHTSQARTPSPSSSNDVFTTWLCSFYNQAVAVLKEKNFKIPKWSPFKLLYQWDSQLLVHFIFLDCQNSADEESCWGFIL